MEQIRATVAAEFERIEAEYEGKLDIAVVRNRADAVLREAGSLVNAALLGALLAMSIIYVFLRNVRSTLVVAMADEEALADSELVRPHPVRLSERLVEIRGPPVEPEGYFSPRARRLAFGVLDPEHRAAQQGEGPRPQRPAGARQRRPGGRRRPREAPPGGEEGGRKATPAAARPQITPNSAHPQPPRTPASVNGVYVPAMSR